MLMNFATPKQARCSALAPPPFMHILFRGGFLFKFGMGGGRGRVSLKRETGEIQNPKCNTLSRARDIFLVLWLRKVF